VEGFRSAAALTPVQWLSGRTSGVWGVGFSRNGRRVVTWGLDSADVASAVFTPEGSSATTVSVRAEHACGVRSAIVSVHVRYQPERPHAGIERSVLESLVTWDKLWGQRRALLLDTCRSGESLSELQRGVGIEGVYGQDEVDQKLGTGLYIIAASSEAGYAIEMGENGLFTRALIDGLDGAADLEGDSDGLVDIEELKEYASRNVHERSGGRQHPTVPRIEGGENFSLARVRGAQDRR
jgi:hypothetical protein